jgi:hypothetical protein
MKAAIPLFLLIAASAQDVPPPRLVSASLPGQEDLSQQLLAIKRVYVDRLTGGETAAQMRDLIISSLQGSKLFILTENADRADATLRGAAEDLIYTDDFQSSDGVDIHSGASSRDGSSAGSRGARNSYYENSNNGHSISLGAGEHESTNIKERKHEALATVRLVNKDGDVIWSTTQESNGAKFRGASADVAERIARQLGTDYDRIRKGRVGPPGN